MRKLSLSAVSNRNFLNSFQVTHINFLCIFHSLDKYVVMKIKKKLTFFPQNCFCLCSVLKQNFAGGVSISVTQWLRQSCTNLMWRLSLCWEQWNGLNAKWTQRWVVLLVLSNHYVSHDLFSVTWCFDIWDPVKTAPDMVSQVLWKRINNFPQKYVFQIQIN